MQQLSRSVDSTSYLSRQDDLGYDLSMPADMRRLDVLIASPGDAKPARNAIEKAMRSWNNHRSDQSGFILRPRRWETGSVPLLGQGDAQSVINTQLVDESDIIIAVFYHRLGSPTARAVSGTAEEIDRSVEAGKPIHLYFAERKLPYTADLAQFEALRDFRRRMQAVGLVATFKSEAELGSAVTNAIEYDISHLAQRAGRSQAFEEYSTEHATGGSLELILAEIYMRGNAVELRIANRALWDIEDLIITVKDIDPPKEGYDLILIGPERLSSGAVGVYQLPSEGGFAALEVVKGRAGNYVPFRIQWTANGTRFVAARHLAHLVSEFPEG